MAIEECKVYGPTGKLKKTISAKECTDHFWEDGFGLDTFGIVKTDKRKQLVASRTQNCVCIQCKNTFQATVSRSYCCNPCTDPSEDSIKVNKFTLKTCAMCKKEFHPKTPRHIFCNNPCNSQAKKRLDGVVKTVSCKLCGKSFQTTGKFKYCRNPCSRWGAWNSKKRDLRRASRESRSDT